MTQIAPVGWYRGIDADGNPLAGGRLFTFEAGTSTPKATYTTKAGTIANANPVILDANGYADVWLDTGGYKFRLENAAGVLQREADNIDGGASTGFASQVVSRSSSFSLSVNDRNFVIVCTSAITASLLPAATAGDGFIAVIVNLSSGNVTIDPDGSETINNASTLVITPGNSATISTDGTEWYAFGYTQTPVEFIDSTFRITDNSDTSKKLAFEVSGVTTGTTTTLSVTNNSLSLPATGSLESRLVLQERLTSGGNTATIVPTNPMASNRTYTLPDVTGTVAVASSGTPTSSTFLRGDNTWALGSIVDRAYSQYTATTGLTAVIPLDNTVPQNTEGTEILTATINVKSTTNRIRARFQGYGYMSVGGSGPSAAMFVNSEASARYAGALVFNTTSNMIALEHEFVPGATGNCTVRIRVGAGSGTITMNTYNGATLGGTFISTLVLEEIAA
jgi:hypothetical protein